MSGDPLTDSSGDPLTERLRAALRPHLNAEPCLLAVSGGPDSTALMHAAAAIATGPVHVATVDHGLRPESAAEAATVAAQASALGLPHATLTWPGPHPATGIQAAARAARYRLLAAQAAAVGATRVLTAHTRDDQAETVLMRLIAGSGPAGLAGMRPGRPLGAGLILVRPFLGLRKDDLVRWCEAGGIAFLRDPGNADPRFARGRLRRLLPLLEAEGLGAERLARLAERAARDETALRGLAEEALAASIVGGSPLVLDGRALLALPEAVFLRVLDRALARVGAAPGYAPVRLERLERLAFETVLPALRTGRRAKRSLRNLLVCVAADGSITVAAAPQRRSGTLAAGASELLGKG